MAGVRTLGEDPVPSLDGGSGWAVRQPCRTPPLSEPRSRSVAMGSNTCQTWTRGQGPRGEGPDDLRSGLLGRLCFALQEGVRVGVDGVVPGARLAQEWVELVV